MPKSIVIPAEPVNILLVDDQPAKLLSYEVILEDLGETLIKATSAREALEHLLKTDVAVILVDVQMPEMDGFELAQMIREHPRFRQTAIIFVSAIHLSEIDRLRGYEAGAVDYVPVPVVPEVLRAKVRVFAELYRKTRDLERLNEELERRVVERTAELEASAARLRDSEERRTVALAAGQMGSWDWDLVTGEVIWDEGQYRIFGIEPGTGPLTLEGVRPFIHPDDLALVQSVAAEAALGRRTFQVEARLLRPDEVRWCICAGAVVAGEGGQVARVSGVTIDITERKRAEQALLNMNEELERRIEERTREREHALAQLFEAQKLDTIGQLTGGVAHDFNNLLMAVLGSLQLLRKRVPDDPRALRLLDNAVQGAERGAALTQRLLAFARRQELKPESVDVTRLVGSMEDLLKRALGPTIRIAKSLPGDLAPVRVDANQLELALLNLAVNARDAMPVGGALAVAACNEAVAPADAVRAGIKAGDYVRISVADTGMGMDEATLARATEPFFTTKGPGKGTGLGLSMVHGLAAQSGGMLRVTSQVGKGTAVELWLPRAADEAAHHAAGRRGRPAGPAEVAQVLPHTILVVDDDLLVSTGTAAMLEDLGHTVIEVHSATQALEILDADPRVEIVITDYAMPGMTGLQLARQLEADRPGLPVILATGYAEWPEGEEAAIQLPRLAKPFKQEELAAAIAAVADRVGMADNVIPIRAR
ncbi:MAG TPA: response regulator [Salinarimonas sp.]|nr:response regulator [Salinarimonas sp.]